MYTSVLWAKTARSDFGWSSQGTWNEPRATAMFAAFTSSARSVASLISSSGGAARSPSSSASRPPAAPPLAFCSLLSSFHGCRFFAVASRW